MVTRLADLTAAADKVTDLRRQLDAASRLRAELALAHVDAGVPVAEVARAAGITRAYVYQLKDARRDVA